jgi:hypothetical protein
VTCKIVAGHVICVFLSGVHKSLIQSQSAAADLRSPLVYDIDDVVDAL